VVLKMVAVSTIKMTSRQYLLLGEDPPGVRLELVDGQIAVHPGQSPGHSHVETALLHALSDRVDSENGHLFLNMDIVLGEHDVRRADLLYFRGDRAHLVHPERAISDPPDLCVEVLSETSRRIDRVDKFAQYARGGVSHYWIVDPDAETIEAFELANKAYDLAAHGSGREIVRLVPFLDLDLNLGQFWFPIIEREKCDNPASHGGTNPSVILQL
jgi:Uma2 family endonuclease